MAVSKPNFFKDHYDWLVALVGLLLLAGVGMLFAQSLENSPEEARAACASELKSRPAAPKNEPKADAIVEKLKAAQVKPLDLAVPSDTNGCFLASARRVHCQNPKCRYPIPDGSKTCWKCNAPQQLGNDEEVVRTGADADQDGMKDAWELKYGLNPNDPTDAKKDLDGDTFTNLEEFEAKTNPKDPNSHPNFLDYLAISGQLKVESLKFCFERADATSRDPKEKDWRITFVLQSDIVKRGFNARVRTQVGDEVVFQSAKPKIVKGKMIYEEEKSGWRVLKYNKKVEFVTKKGTEQKVPMDMSTVDLERISDKRKLSVQVGVRKPIAVEEQVDLQWSRGEGQTITVTTGSKFKLKDREYEVKKLVREGNACKVIVVDLKTKEEKIIQ